MNDHNDVSAEMTSAVARHYQLVCSFCGRRQDDDGLILECPADHPPALLQTDYAGRKFQPRAGQEGLFRYQEWLPVRRVGEEVVGRTLVYRSRGLASALRLPNLWVAFNGYWPERGADLETATFKEFVAHTVLARLPDHRQMLAVASSGNTGAAFARACSRRRVPCLLIIPSKGLSRLKFRAPLHSCVSLVVIEDGGYPDAIELASAASLTSSFQAEGGIKNVARRDGLATVLLAAFEEMHRLPSHYFQAVGSGTGAIGVHEAAKRLRATMDDMALPRLMLCQNLPFTPIYDAWRRGQSSLSGRENGRFRAAASRVCADELTNWAPPYEIRGGLYDALVESSGDVLVAGNAAVRRARNMFQELEGIDIEPSAGVAVACLCDAVTQEKIGKDSAVLLNITGGGRSGLAKDYPLVTAQPRLRLNMNSVPKREAVRKIVALCT